jgi:hypothetical protein
MSQPPAPYVEDVYDSDGSVVPGTRREAGNHAHAPSTKPLMQHMRKSGRDAASDSGYSSHASNTVASSTNSQPSVGAQHTRQSSQPMNQNTIGRRGSQRGQVRLSRSPSVPACTDPRCGDSKCASSQNIEPNYALPHRPHTQRSQTMQYPVQDAGPAMPHIQAQNYQYPQHPVAQPAPHYYNPQAETRPRAPSASQSRPTSWAPGAYPYANLYPQTTTMPQGSYGAQPHALPPSTSTQNMMPHMPQYPTTGTDWQNMPSQMTSNSPRDSYGAYVPAQAMSIPSNGQNYTSTYSVRQGYQVPSGQEISTPSTTYQQSSQPAISARRASVMPGSFPGEALAFGSPSGSSSESSDSEDDHDRRRHEPSRRREQSRRRKEEHDRTRRVLEDRMAMPPPSIERERERRPILKTARTTPADSRHRSRDPPRRAPYPEPDLLSSEYVDPDRTARPVVSKRLTYSDSRQKRQPAITHHRQPSRERPSSLSYGSQPVHKYVVEDSNGRKSYYDTLEEAEYKRSRLDQQQREADIEAYQAKTRGNLHPATLTTGDLKRAQTHPQEKRPASHASGSSRKSTSSRISASESMIQIKHGDAIYTIPGDKTVEIITKGGETMVIGPGSPPREKSYHGSSSGGSRMGRSRNGSEYGGRRRDTITEEDGYERAL